MKRFQIIYTIDDDQMKIETYVDGFSTLEMLAALDIKREDIMNQCIHFAEFKRTRKFPDGTEMEVTKKKKQGKRQSRTTRKRKRSLGVSAGREATQQREEDINMEHTHGGEDNATD
jgi:hypothetical protein